MQETHIAVRRLQIADEIITARHLVYQMYVSELGWVPPNDNPSGIHVDIALGLRVLSDRYDSIALWYGAYQHSQMIGCCRICPRLNGLFELELYHEIPDCIKQERCAYEMNRFAAKDGYEKDTLLVHLMESILSSAIQESYSVFSTTGMGNKRVFERLRNG